MLKAKVRRHGQVQRPLSTQGIWLSYAFETVRRAVWEYAVPLGDVLRPETKKKIGKEIV